jgi:hypothetical protein
LVDSCCHKLRKSCAGANTYSRAERVFVLEHYFAKELPADFCDEFSNVHADNKAPKKQQ